MAPTHWATQSAVTDPGKAASVMDGLPADIPSLRRLTSQLLLHYRGRADEVPEGRLPEIHTRYADAMFDLVLSRGDASLTRDRAAADRLVGCCRDATVLFLALARHKGIPARARVGFGSYFRSGWWMDHAVAEVWDGQRWRLVDAQMDEGDGVDWCDLTPDQFLTGPAAWRAARAGEADAHKFVVSPSLELEALRGWPYLAHNVVHDLVAMGKTEMLLWDAWGMQLGHEGGPVPDDDGTLLDEVSAALMDPDVEPQLLAKLGSRHGLAIPPVVTRFDPNGGPPHEVDVSRVLQGV